MAADLQGLDQLRRNRVTDGGESTMNTDATPDEWHHIPYKPSLRLSGADITAAIAKAVLIDHRTNLFGFPTFPHIGFRSESSEGITVSLGTFAWSQRFVEVTFQISWHDAIEAVARYKKGLPCTLQFFDKVQRAVAELEAIGRRTYNGAV